MNSSPFPTLLDAQQALLSQLADTWLDLGAHAFYLTDLTGHPLVQWPPFPPAGHSTFTAPIYINGQSIGKLHVHGKDSTTARKRLAADAQILSQVLQLEYELDRMTTDIIDQQDQLMALHQMAQLTRVHNSLRQTLTNLAQITAQLLKTEYAFLALQSEQRDSLRVLYPAAIWSEAQWETIWTLFKDDANRQQWLLHPWDPLLNSLDTPLRSLMVKRVAVRQGTALLLGAANKFDGDFQAPDLKLFSTIAEPAAANLENALLHRDMLDQTRIQTEMDLARQVQMRLLPQRIPSVPGMELAAQSRPASHVGGDFYDFLINAEEILTLTLGDVSGKGMPAALLMSMLRTVLRGKAQEMNTPQPEQLLGNTNEYLYSDFSDVDMFATLFVGQYDYRRHVLHYANDGHAPVIYRPVHGQAHLLAADAPPLGIMPMNLAEQYQIAFAPGDLLLVTSDGFSEAENHQGEMFGYERLLQLTDELASANATAIIQGIFKTVDQFTHDRPQSDDQTLLVLKRTERDVIPS
ncbi:MAG: PP2C family protein-serine/threonine phosphatase [Caldilineaceae bacterium]|nr:PP2C family protein-serine/threonine phosphatase [Caldilineaceae bacterium]